MNRPELHVSILPHVHSGSSVRRLIMGTICGLLPVLFAGWFYFGWPALKIVAISAMSAIVIEYLWDKMVGHPTQIGD